MGITFCEIDVGVPGDVSHIMPLSARPSFASSAHCITAEATNILSNRLYNIPLDVSVKLLGILLQHVQTEVNFYLLLHLADVLIHLVMRSCAQWTTFYCGVQIAVLLQIFDSTLFF